MKIIILSNGPGLSEIVSLYGHSSEWIPNSINKKNIQYSVVKTYENILFDYSDADAFIVTGSKYSVYDDAKWIHDLKLKIQELIDFKKPILGICFGHQLLAECLGGKVEKNIHGWELGSYKISLTEEGRKNSLFNKFYDNDIVYESHQDVVTSLPSKAIELAYTDKGNQSFCFEDYIYGVQFHPEFSYNVTRKLMDLRIDKGIKVDNNILLESVNSRNILINFIDIVNRRRNK